MRQNVWYKTSSFAWGVFAVVSIIIVTITFLLIQKIFDDRERTELLKDVNNSYVEVEKAVTTYETMFTTFKTQQELYDDLFIGVADVLEEARSITVPENYENLELAWLNSQVESIPYREHNFGTRTAHENFSLLELRELKELNQARLILVSQEIYNVEYVTNQNTEQTQALTEALNEFLNSVPDNAYYYLVTYPNGVSTAITNINKAVEDLQNASTSVISKIGAYKSYAGAVRMLRQSDNVLDSLEAYYRSKYQQVQNSGSNVSPQQPSDPTHPQQPVEPGEDEEEDENAVGSSAETSNL